MVYTKQEKDEIERVRKVFAEHIQQSPNYDLLWSDKVGYVWLSTDRIVLSKVSAELKHTVTTEILGPVICMGLMVECRRVFAKLLHIG